MGGEGRRGGEICVPNDFILFESFYVLGLSQITLFGSV